MSSSTVTKVMALDGHLFDMETQVWDDTEVWSHEDCHGADYTLVRVGDYWSWYAQVSPEVTVRVPEGGARRHARDAMSDAQQAVRDWQALNAW